MNCCIRFWTNWTTWINWTLNSCRHSSYVKVMSCCDMRATPAGPAISDAASGVIAHTHTAWPSCRGLTWSSYSLLVDGVEKWLSTASRQLSGVVGGTQKLTWESAVSTRVSTTGLFGVVLVLCFSLFSLP